MADICQSNTLQRLWTLILGAFCLFYFSFSLYFELNIKKNVECQISIKYGPPLLSVLRFKPTKIIIYSPYHSQQQGGRGHPNITSNPRERNKVEKLVELWLFKSILSHNSTKIIDFNSHSSTKIIDFNSHSSTKIIDFNSHNSTKIIDFKSGWTMTIKINDFGWTMTIKINDFGWIVT
jgi:hypothetical protein